ncbi:hypothetical protein TSOC_012762 [Tetrabaena socialis]|uniref:Uncharacterized protein n=1 Tax=Tetrabaena socialis TaxID=47790 RepID=A0A2J7ZM53_9CHLO|nr:hypothetical protein TSOC_012762 [Tetrabaena socialis]|eukprot:PNH01346.1 hypothetical protein TSOC_012762 [Tetrabaena socialis]
MKQPLVDDGRSEQARARWQRTEGIAAAVGRIAAVGRAPKTVIAKVDLFAIDLKPSTVAGGVISVLVLLGTVIYTALITYAYVHRDASQSNNMLWSQASRTLFPMNVTCVAASCILSNTYPGASLPTPPSPAEACLRLGFNETTVLHLAFSNDPSDGLAILFDPTATDSAFPLGAGVYVSSEMGCDGGPGCVDDIIIMRLLVGPGLTLANYVRTNNETEPAGSRARLRQEWFLSYVSDAHSVSTARPCFAALSGAEVEGLQQAPTDAPCLSPDSVG